MELTQAREAMRVKDSLILQQSQEARTLAETLQRRYGTACYIITTTASSCLIVATTSSMTTTTSSSRRSEAC